LFLGGAWGRKRRRRVISSAGGRRRWLRRRAIACSVAFAGGASGRRGGGPRGLRFFRELLASAEELRGLLGVCGLLLGAAGGGRFLWGAFRGHLGDLLLCVVESVLHSYT
jgi:hypothetical protein